MEEVIQMMKDCREICRIASKLRNIHKLPNRLPLKELQYSGKFLWKSYQNLIRDDANVVDINPFICKAEQERYNEQWVEIEENGIKVALNIQLDDWQILQEHQTRERRRKIMENKKINN